MGTDSCILSIIHFNFQTLLDKQNNDIQTIKNNLHIIFIKFIIEFTFIIFKRTLYFKMETIFKIIESST